MEIKVVAVYGEDEKKAQEPNVASFSHKRFLTRMALPLA